MNVHSPRRGKKGRGGTYFLQDERGGRNLKKRFFANSAGGFQKRQRGWKKKPSRFPDWKREGGKRLFGGKTKVVGLRKRIPQKGEGQK